MRTGMQDLVQGALEATGLTTYQGVVVVGVGVLTTAYLVSKLTGKGYKLAPGQYKFPIIGNMLQLLFSKLPAEENFFELSKKYGPVIRNNILGLEFVVLNDVTVVREALVTKQDDFSHRPVFWTGQVMSDGGKDILWGNPGPEWKYQRQIVHQAIRKYASGENLERMVTGVYEQVVGLVGQQTGPQLVKPLTKFFAYNFVCSLSFGREYAPDDEIYLRLKKIMEDFQNNFGSGNPADFMPSLAYCPLMWPKMNKTRNTYAYMKRFVEENIKEHRRVMEEGDGSSNPDLTDFILTQQMEAEKAGSSKKLITEDCLLYTVFDVFGAGLDTMNTTLDWLVGYLMQHPDIQSRLHQEIDAVYEPGKSLLDIRHQVPYVEAVINETMRIATVSPLGLPLCTACDTSVGGYDIPKGCMVFPNIWALHHNPDYWEDPDTFNPDRFLDPDGALRQRITCFMPFGLGRRACIGEVLAKSALVMFVVLLFHKFKFSIPKDCPDWKLQTHKVSIFHIPVNYLALVEERQ